MSRTRLLIVWVSVCVLALGFGAGRAWAQDGGTSVLGERPRGAPALGVRGAVGGGNASSVGRAEVGGAARPSVSVTTARPPVNFWDIQLHAPTAARVRRGDALLASFWARCVESMTGDATFQFDFETNGPPHDKSVSARYGVGGAWRRFEIPFESIAGYRPGEAQAVIQVGFGPQTLEVAGFELRNFGGRDLSTLPRTAITYAGRGADAAWRAEAEARIERLRTGELRVEVLDGGGRAVPGARVRVEQRRHAFSFGTAVVARDLASDDPATARYRELVEELFNEVVFENDLKWVSHGFGAPRDIDRALSWLEAREIGVRGHVLVWPGWRWLPPALRGLEDEPARLREAVERRVETTAGRYAGRLVDWDVVNEPFSDHDLMDILGERVMADWFGLAREHDPRARLYINDWGILTAGVASDPHIEHYHRTVRRLLAWGAPVGGIGVQGHFSEVFTPPPTMLAVLDRFAELGPRIKITELDIDSADAGLQADFMRDVLTVAFSHPGVDGVLLWGFWSERHWKPEAALFDADWNVRPVGRAWLDLVRGRWWTDESAATGADGVAAVRAFRGVHLVSAEVGGDRVEAEVELDGAAGSVTLRVDR